MLSKFLEYNFLIPFALAGLCNLWVGCHALFVKKEVPLACAFFSWAASSIFMCWHHFTIGD